MGHPTADFDRIPYSNYHDPDIYNEELKCIFEGDTWSFLGLEAEIPNPGDFRRTFIGETPIIYNRDRDGKIHTFVNRCSHRGALIQRENFGNVTSHICLYHSWAYDLNGDLIGVPHRNGVGGSPGMPDDFDMTCHGLRKLRVDSINGVLFATFSESVETLEDYLGPAHVDHLDRLFHKPVKVLGYQRQFVRSNWKAYLENVRDHYHGALLHGFQSTFGINRSTHDCGSRMDVKADWHLAPRNRPTTASPTHFSASRRFLAQTTSLHRWPPFFDCWAIRQLGEFRRRAHARTVTVKFGIGIRGGNCS